MASPTINSVVFTPDPPVSGQPFTMKVNATDPDVQPVVSYQVTVQDDQGNPPATGVATSFSDKLSYAVAPIAGSPPLTPDVKDPSLFHGIAP